MTIKLFGHPTVCFAPEGAAAGSDSGGSSSAAAPSGGGATAPAPTSSPSGASPSPAGPTPPASSPTAPSAPSPGPAGGAPSTPAAAQPPDDANNFDFMDEPFDDMDELAGIEPATPQAMPAEPPAPAQVPVQAAPAEPQAPAPAAPQAPAQPTGTPTSAPGPQDATPLNLSPAEPHVIAAALANDQAAIIDHLAANDFALSPEDVEALETNAPAHIPKLLARMYVKSTINTLQTLARSVPAMMQRYNQITERNTTNENKFYSRWPSIKKDTHGQLVSRLARTYRQMNPQASLDQMVEDLGPIVMMSAKIPQAAGAPNGGAQVSTGPTGTPRPPPSPFRPAMGGSAAIPQQGDENPWMGLAAPDEDE